MTNYFAVLGVPGDTDLIGIRRAYKKLAQKYHPDKWQGETDEANRKMMEINEAYAVLSEPKLRFKYHSQLKTNERDDESLFQYLVRVLRAWWSERQAYRDPLDDEIYSKYKETVDDNSKESEYWGNAFLLKMEFNQNIRRAEMGHKISQFRVGNYYENNPVKPNYHEAVRWYGLSADQMYPKAIYSLAMMYSEGKGVIQNYERAIMLLQQASEKGVPGNRKAKKTLKEVVAKSRKRLGTTHEKTKGLY